MGMRFRKSVSLGKGTRLNFSKSGVSTSFGRRGFSVTKGKRGTYMNVGIPGTGISYRTKIGGGKKTSSNRRTNSGRQASSQPRIHPAILEWAQYTGESNPTCGISLDVEGNYTFTDSAGNEIIDPNLIAIIKRTPQFKELNQQLKATAAQEAATAVQNTLAESEQFITIHNASPEVSSYEDYEDQLDNLVLYECQPQPFPEMPPTQETISLELSEEADREVKTPAFWKQRKLKEQYFNDHYNERFNQRVNEWSARKAQFEAAQAQHVAQENQRLLEEYNEQNAFFQNALNGTPEFIESTAELWMGELELPVEIFTQFEYRPEGNTLMVDLDLPEIEDLPTETAVQLKSGVMKKKEKTQKALREEYAQCVFGVAIFVASTLFNVSPAIQRIVLSGYTQRRNAAGDINDDYIFSIAFIRDSFYGVDFESIDPEAFCMSFENRCKLSTTKVFKNIEPYE